MVFESSSSATKESIKQQLCGKDLQCRYYEAIVNTTTDLITLTDGVRVIDANKAMVDFCDEMNLNIYGEDFSFTTFFQPIQKFGYVYEGHQGLPWSENVLKHFSSDCKVGILNKGTLRTFNITLRPLEFFKNIYVMTLNDVTEMMGYKAALEEGIKSSVKDRDKTQLLLRQYDKAMEASTLVFKCDTDGIITYANRALSEVLLYGKGELEGKHFSVLRGKSITDKMNEDIWTQVQKGKIYRGTLEITDKLGGSHYLDVSFVPIVDEEKNIVEFFSLSHEITEVVQAKETAIKTLEAKNKFFDQASHELRTPLNAIINFTDSALESFDEILLDEESRELVRMYIERAHNNSQHLLKLINSLLDMAKLRAGKETFTMVSYDARELVNDVFHSTEALNTSMAVDFILESVEESVMIVCDVLKTRQILINLISNALKFTKMGSVKVVLKVESKKCTIEVVDSGLGIPESKLSKIFEPFEQVSANDQGTGLGLGIANEYAKGMKMKLSVKSTLDEGSCFILTIPLVEEK